MENGILTMIFKQVFKKYLALFTSSAFYKSTWYLTFGIPYDDVDTGIERMNEMTQQAQKALLPLTLLYYPYTILILVRWQTIYHYC